MKRVDEAQIVSNQTTLPSLRPLAADITNSLVGESWILPARHRPFLLPPNTKRTEHRLLVSFTPVVHPSQRVGSLDRSITTLIPLHYTSQQYPPTARLSPHHPDDRSSYFLSPTIGANPVPYRGSQSKPPFKAPDRLPQADNDESSMS